MSKGVCSWVLVFLQSPNNGLLVLIDYMQQLLNDAFLVSRGRAGSLGDISAGTSQQLSDTEAASTVSNGPTNGSTLLFRRATSTSKTKTSKNVGDVDDDISVCISCLRAILNNKVSSPRIGDALERAETRVRESVDDLLHREEYPASEHEDQDTRRAGPLPATTLVV